MTKEDILHHFQDINFYYNDCMMYDDLSRMLDELIVESQREWIPVSERLPEESGEYLISIKDRSYTEISWFYPNDKKWSYRNADIVAWAYIPESYTGGE